MNDRPLVVLGATGSIGSQTLEVADRLSQPVAVVAARSASDGLLRIAERFPDAQVIVSEPEPDSRERFNDALGKRVDFGAEAIIDAAARPNHTIINGIVGAAGLGASMAAVVAGNRLGLANKESMVMAGPVINQALTTSDALIVPVDSEHSAIFQCLHGERSVDVSRLVLTASGGPFRGRSRQDLTGITPAEALAHPTWDMGRRISIDSATLVNKGLEVIEAHYLFGFDYDRIDVVVHPQSIVHSLVEFVDGSLKAHVGEPDMRVPIQYAISYPERWAGTGQSFSLAGNTLEFFEPDREVFPALDLAYAVGREGGGAPAAFNAADEVAVEAFLDEKIGFADVVTLIESVLDELGHLPCSTIDEAIDADVQARASARRLVSDRVNL